MYIQYLTQILESKHFKISYSQMKLLLYQCAYLVRICAISLNAYMHHDTCMWHHIGVEIFLTPYEYSHKYLIVDNWHRIYEELVMPILAILRLWLVTYYWTTEQKHTTTKRTLLRMFRKYEGTADLESYNLHHHKALYNLVDKKWILKSNLMDKDS